MAASARIPRRDVQLRSLVLEADVVGYRLGDDAGAADGHATGDGFADGVQPGAPTSGGAVPAAGVAGLPGGEVCRLGGDRVGVSHLQVDGGRMAVGDHGTEARGAGLVHGGALLGVRIELYATRRSANWPRPTPR